MSITSSFVIYAHPEIIARAGKTAPATPAPWVADDMNVVMTHNKLPEASVHDAVQQSISPNEQQRKVYAVAHEK